MAADLFTDFPERFAERRVLHALFPSGERRAYEVEEHWPHKGRMIFKLKGVDSITGAEVLLGCELQIPKAERAELEAGATYISDLVGCTVSDEKAGEIGRITGVQFGAGEAPLLEIERAGKEILVPFVAEYIRRLDLENKRLELALPEGMLELDAPLSANEKREQAKGEGS